MRGRDAVHAVMVANDTTFVYHLRREIIAQLLKEGHRVTVLAQVRSFRAELEAMGARVIDVQTNRRSMSILADVRLFFRYLTLLKRLKPDVMLSNSIKPNVYAGLACRLLGVRYLPNITGLGTAVENPGRLQALTTWLYKLGVAGADCVFFQNTANESFFRQRGMLSRRGRSRLLPGSGVNLETHQAMPCEPGDKVHFLFVARLMKEKGVDLYLAAAKAIHGKYGNVMFHICGLCDDERYLAVLRQAERDGYVRYHGEQKDMVPFFRQAHCLVHPSYYPEGMSNVLLEVAASARPIIATERPGCRETVDDGVSGFVVPVKDEAALIGALERFMALTWEERCAMGQAGRAKMEREFDRRRVVAMVMEEVERGSLRTVSAPAENVNM